MIRTIAKVMMAAALAAGAGEARAQEAPPPERGLVLASVSAAMEQRLEPIEDLSIVVSLSERTLSLMSGDRVVRQYPAAIGKRTHPTPAGTFRIRRIEWNPSWHPPASPWARGRTPEPPGSPTNPMGRVKILFQGNVYYIHGTNQPSSLGEAASHGCVRLRDADAAEVARYVMMAGGADRSPEWFRQVAEQRRTTHTVAIRQPVTLRIVR
jgi:lipoprotein-anchoring transpeptidase ErfK/SrfK